MKKVRIDMHHSQVPDPPEDIVDAAFNDFDFPSREMTKQALKCWHVAAAMNGWDAQNCPDYMYRYAMFMGGFLAGYNLHEAEFIKNARTN